ncbi:5'-AMP-activated protein kinase subunit beta-2 [Lepeophtheirus salmonis]|uniref:5'-AMP-activated protein kinase subunit beta-1 n=1 Tax=Lepeophtheirus salmonis TaxID=72036 RepID=A0A0K2TYU4_LEPSM|nr:5'-AMP-activated protein kinase subunit beta-2-like [Lepeophtheirus salmonis]XP_040569210.1 5'-AMP-activated protein kinase subunit beta-2-like [Lepeophtheirus salmonis]
MGNHQGILQQSSIGKKYYTRNGMESQPINVTTGVEADHWDRNKDTHLLSCPEDPGPLSLMSRVPDLTSSIKSVCNNASITSFTKQQRSRANTIGVRPIMKPKMLSKDKNIPTVFKLPLTDLQKVKKDAEKKQIYLCGSFDNWSNLIPMNQSHANFVTILELPQGNYQYKFKVDNTWVISSKDPVTDDGFGGQNNLINIKTSDNEVFEALDMDIKEKNIICSNEFGQEVPNYISGKDKLGSSQIHPPILPPHLLQVILNKDTPLSCEPTLLPTPNHVMINHLYALSIKDKVMVMSSTQRFRKKYVTTVLYRPIQD